MVQGQGLVHFNVFVKQTDLWIAAESRLEREARDLALSARQQVETYIAQHPLFLTTLVPWEDDPFAPPIVRQMIQGGRRAGVGPMAAVAGAIAQWVGEGLLRQSAEVVVENGGDIFLASKRSLTVALLAGQSPLSGKLGLVIPESIMPVSVCSSSGTIGHSLSEGRADVVTVVARSGSVADAAATALGNMVKGAKELREVVERAKAMEEILGVVIIHHETLATWGQVELRALS